MPFVTSFENKYLAITPLSELPVHPAQGTSLEPGSRHDPVSPKVPSVLTPHHRSVLPAFALYVK